MQSSAESTQGRLNNKTAFISGSGSGIGRETALLFVREGAKVALGDKDVAKIRETHSEITQLGGDAHLVPLDVTSEADWRAATGQIRDAWGALDILVNCAGITDDAPITELSVAQWRHVLTTNLEGTFLGTAAALRIMSPRGSGSIINVSSISGIKASPGASAYCASKAGIIQFSKVAALECAEAGNRIRVNCVVPGGVKTPMWEKTPMWPEISFAPEWTAPPDAAPLKRFARPVEVAQVILFLASDESSYVTGSTLIVDGGATA